ncbi:DUF4912 domain-containing protein [Bacillus sp. AK128]
MIQDIIKLRNEGLSFREIAKELDSTVGKVHYRWNKHFKDGTENIEVQPPKPLALLNEQLPFASYNLDTMCLMVKDYSSLYVYWELSDVKKKFLEHICQLSWSDLPKLIKVYDVTSLLFNGSNAHRECEIPIPEMTNNWFITDLEPNRTYLTEFGIKRENGSFFSILRSNPIDTPRNSPHQVGLFSHNVHQWKTGKQSTPDWLEQFSTYSYYEKIK